MDLFLSWFDLKPGVSDVAFCEAVEAYLSPLKQRGEIAGWRLTRRKLAFGPAELGEWFLVIEVEGLAQLDRAFTTVSTRAGPIEGLHAAVNQKACNLRAALYRDFPDPQRVRGEERF
ncbi:MAG TPA: DUF6614 family protein [Anaeromyxobacter sp.]